MHIDHQKSGYDKVLSGMAQAIHALRLLCFDWIGKSTRPYWQLARRELNNLAFRAHASIPPISLINLVSRLTVEPHPEVMLPSIINIPGSDDPNYYYSLAVLSKILNPKQVIEFGTFLGVGTLAIALNTAPDCCVWTIDLPAVVDTDAVSSLDSSDRALVDRSRYKVGEAFFGHSVANRVIQIRENSLAINLRSHILGSVDMVFIDGGHSFEIVERDSENALSALSSTGVIVWDDYWWFYPDVVKYLDLLSNKLCLFRIEGTNLVIYAQGRGFDRTLQSNS